MSTQSRAPLGRVEFIALMAALMAMNALAIDIMLPALPAMGEALHVANANQRQLVIGSYILGFGAAQLVIGPLSDRFGRKAPILVGLGIYIATALGASLVSQFEWLLVLRLVQGLGASTTRVITISIVRDLYAGTMMAEITSLIFMVFMIVPIMAPNLGQLILLGGHWALIFVLMAALACVIWLWTWSRLPETLAPEQRRALTFTSVVQAFRIVFSTRSALFFGLSGMFLMGGLFGMLTSSQQIYVDLYGLGALFPVAFAATAGVMSLSSFINARIVSRFGMLRVSSAAIIGYVALALVLLAASLIGQPPLWLFFCVVTGLMCCFGWASANTNALSMQPLGAVAGTAASVFGFMQTVGSALLGSAVGQSFNGSVRPLAAGFLIFGLCALVCQLIASGGALFAKDPAKA